MSHINITNGKYLNDYLKSKLNGEFIPFNEAMIQGKLLYPLFDDKFNESRCKTHKVTTLEYLENIKDFLNIKEYSSNIILDNQASVGVKYKTIGRRYCIIKTNGITIIRYLIASHNDYYVRATIRATINIKFKIALEYNSFACINSFYDAFAKFCVLCRTHILKL